MWEQRPGHLSRLGSSEKTQGVCYQRCHKMDADLAGEGREVCPQLEQQHLPAPEEGFSEDFCVCRRAQRWRDALEGQARSACLRCLQKCTAGHEWGRVTGSP